MAACGELASPSGYDRLLAGPKVLVIQMRGGVAAIAVANGVSHDI
jgi:hypothetical protein